MICIRGDGGFAAQLGDYVDRTLPAPARAALDAHLAACPACAALAADLQAIRAAVFALDQHTPPARVWARIAAAIEPPPTPRHWLAWLSGWQPVAAAAAAIVLTTSLWWVGQGLRPAAEEDRRAIAAEQTGAADRSLQYAEAHFSTAIAGLEAITRSEGTALDPLTASVLQANLTVIDAAIVESRTALASEPESDLAQQSLIEALHTKVVLLQDTLTLINGVRGGIEDDAAGPGPGTNQ